MADTVHGLNLDPRNRVEAVSSMMTRKPIREGHRVSVNCTCTVLTPDYALTNNILLLLLLMQ